MAANMDTVGTFNMAKEMARVSIVVISLLLFHFVKTIRGDCVEVELA